MTSSGRAGAKKRVLLYDAYSTLVFTIGVAQWQRENFPPVMQNQRGKMGRLSLWMASVFDM